MCENDTLAAIDEFPMLPEMPTTVYSIWKSKPEKVLMGINLMDINGDKIPPCDIHITSGCYRWLKWRFNCKK